MTRLTSEPRSWGCCSLPIAFDCSETIDIIEDCTICCNPNSISYTVENEKVVCFEVVKTY